MNNTELIQMLLKQYVDQNEDFQRAQRIVNEHKKIQEKLKELFEKEGIDQYVLQQDGYFAVLGFKRGTYMRVDIAMLPEEIKNLYQKEVVMKRETFNVISKP